jgi:hypothetical protein
VEAQARRHSAKYDPDDERNEATSLLSEDSEEIDSLNNEYAGVLKQRFGPVSNSSQSPASMNAAESDCESAARSSQTRRLRNGLLTQHHGIPFVPLHIGEPTSPERGPSDQFSAWFCVCRCVRRSA